MRKLDVQVNVTHTNTHAVQMVWCWWRDGNKTDTQNTNSPKLFGLYLFNSKLFCCCCWRKGWIFFYFPSTKIVHILRVKFENNQRNGTETKCLSDRKWVFRHYFPFWDLNQSSQPADSIKHFLFCSFTFGWEKSLVTFLIRHHHDVQSIHDKNRFTS